MSTVSWIPIVHGEPITIAIFGSAFAASFGGAIVSALIGFGISWLGGQVINWIFGDDKDKEADKQADARLTIQFGERVARSGIMGTVLCAGHMAHINEYNDAKILQMVQIVADQKVTSLVGVRINGEMYSLTETTATDNAHHCYTVLGFDGTIKIRLHDGRVGQAADTTLVAQTLGWDSTKKFSSMAYIVSEVTSNKDVYNGTPPEIIPVVAGGVWYDPRKDSSVGGSGSHRFNDQSTWEYTANNAVMAMHFLRGVFFNGVRVLGAGVPLAKLDVDSFIAAMNACDEDVLDPAGSLRNRFECHNLFDDLTEYGGVLDFLCEGMAGYWCERGGKIAIFAGKAQSSVLTITDADIPIDEEVYFDDKRSGETLYQGIMGTYTSSLDWQALAYTAIVPPELEITNVEPKILEQHYPQVKNAHQAFCVARIKLYSNNVQGSAQIALDIKDMIVQAGDWITWNSDIPYVGERDWLVMGARVDLKKMRMYLTLSETSADIFSDTATIDDIAEPTRNFPISGYTQSVNVTALNAIALVGTSGSRLPALRFEYDPITDPAISGILFEYWRDDLPGVVIRVTDDSPSDGYFITTMGLTPGYTYVAQATPISIPGRAMITSDEITADIPLPDLVASPDPEFSAMVNWMNDSWRAIIEGEQLISGQAYGQDLSNWTDRNELRRNLKVSIDYLGTEVTAAYTEAIEVAVGPGSAVADAVAAVTAIYGDVSSGVLTRWTAFASPGGGWARYGIQVRSSVGAGWPSSASGFWEAKSDGSSRIVFQAGEFNVVDALGNIGLAIGTDGLVPYTRIPNLNADRINAGQIIAGKIGVGALNATNLFVNGVVITDLIAANASSKTDIYSSAGAVNVSNGAGSPQIAAVVATVDGGTGNRVKVMFTSNLFASFNNSNNWGSFQATLYLNGSPVATCVSRPDDENQDGIMIINYVYAGGSGTFTWQVLCNYITSPGPGANIYSRNNYLEVTNFKK